MAKANKKAAPPKAVKPPTDKVSKPDEDFTARIVTMGFLPRAGLKTYAEELKERLKDVEDGPQNSIYYLLPVKLPRAVYKKLLEGALAMAPVSPNWTERDQIEALVNFLDARTLTAGAVKA